MFVIPGISASSFSTTPSSATSPSSSQESTSANRDSVSNNRGVETPVSERSGGTNEELRGEPLHESTETENHNKKRNRRKYKEIYRMNCLIGYRNSRIIWLMNVLQKSFGETRCRGVQTLPVRLVNLQWSREHARNWVRVSTVLKLASRKIRNCEICQRTKNYKGPVQNTHWYSHAQSETVWWFDTADHKVLSEESESRNNHRYVEVVQDLATQWIQSYLCKSKSSHETQKNLIKFPEPARKPKVIYTDNSLDFGIIAAVGGWTANDAAELMAFSQPGVRTSCEELSWNHCTSTPHRSETSGIAERAVRREKEETSAVLL